MTTTVPRPAGPRGYGLVGAAADRRIRPLQRGYRNDAPSSVSAVARLRRGAGHPAHHVQDLWGAVGTAELEHVLAAAEPAERQGLHADRADEALHLAITLWALHQQSHRDTDTHVVGYGLGRSVRLLMAPGAGRPQGDAAVTDAPQEGAVGEQLIDEGLRRRFVRVGTATTLDVLSQRLREIVLLLRKDTVPLDYALLADQLYWWQFPGVQADVRRTWGRDFHTAGTRARSTPRV
ncbi:type I-E CRISPR-associated protein Cse2/CasB [Streptomyces sp. NPDC004031]